jgi:hypothetical protein
MRGLGNFGLGVPRAQILSAEVGPPAPDPGEEPTESRAIITDEGERIVTDEGETIVWD